jgi:hypothetical protein
VDDGTLFILPPNRLQSGVRRKNSIEPVETSRDPMDTQASRLPRLTAPDIRCW